MRKKKSRIVYKQHKQNRSKNRNRSNVCMGQYARVNLQHLAYKKRFVQEARKNYICFFSYNFCKVKKN